MGQCTSQELKVKKDLHLHKTPHFVNKISPTSFLDMFDFKVHIVKVNDAIPGSLEIVFMNNAAIKTYGVIPSTMKWPLIGIMSEKNINVMIDSVLTRRKQWKCIVCEDVSNMDCYSNRQSDDMSVTSNDSMNDVSIHYPPPNQIQRALVALQQQQHAVKMQRKSLQVERHQQRLNNVVNHPTKSNQLQHTPMSSVRTWYEIRCYPYMCDGDDTILVVQYDVTRHVQRNNALMRMTDNHLRVLQQLYPSHFILDSPDGVNGLMEHTDFSRFSDHHDNVIIMFADIVGFTSMCKVVSPEQVMAFLLHLYQEFDKLIQTFPDLFKYEVAGDCYIAVAGLINRDKNGFISGQGRKTLKTKTKTEMRRLSIQMMKFALSIQEFATSMTMPHDITCNVLLHIGIHVGPVVSGIIGLTSPKFMLFGDTMNTTSRLETTCPAGKMQVSNEMYNILPAGSIAGGGLWKKTNGVEVKGKGLMDTWILVSPSPTTNTPIEETLNEYDENDVRLQICS